MPLAMFKDMCMDAGDVTGLARFWAEVLGGRVVDGDDGSPARLDVATPDGDDVVFWVNPVPEPRVGKTRVHLDLQLAEPDPAPLLRAGATMVREPGDDPWWVLADPEGNLFCAHPPGAERRPAGVFEINVDCADARAQVEWWARVVGGTVRHNDGYSWIEGAAAFPWESWAFGPVPEPKRVKNRWHWDVDLVGPDPGPLVAAGATVLREPLGRAFWWVLADPEGNEFCAFPADDD